MQSTLSEQHTPVVSPMVNTWPGIPTHCLCLRHLNSACNEATGLLRYHMLKGHRIDGWIRTGCIDLETLDERIEELLAEAKSRGLDWKYEFREDHKKAIAEYRKRAAASGSDMKNEEAIAENMKKLMERCGMCGERMKTDGIPGGI